MNQEMIISKIYNNNCVSVNINNREYIVTGSGVGFGKKINEKVDNERIEKRFEIMGEHKVQFEDMIVYTDVRFFNLARRILEMAEYELKLPIDNKATISLTDHITFALKRYDEGQKFLPLFDEGVKTFYRNEYDIGVKALEIIHEEEEAKLPIEEAAYIAMHIINATHETNTSNFAQKITIFIDDTIKIIEKSEGITLDKSKIEIIRLITHLKYLGARIVDDEHNSIYNLNVSGDSTTFYYELHTTKKTVNHLSHYISREYEYDLSANELLYLAIHLHQVLDAYRIRNDQKISKRFLKKH